LSESLRAYPPQRFPVPPLSSCNNPPPPHHASWQFPTEVRPPDDDDDASRTNGEPWHIMDVASSAVHKAGEGVQAAAYAVKVRQGIAALTWGSGAGSPSHVLLARGCNGCNVWVLA
jgi:hypothetical protein